MPKIPQYVLNCIFFLYRTSADADAAINPQGTGFLASMPSRAIPNVTCPPHLYAITNWHVMRDAPVIRIETTDGGYVVKDLDPATDWYFAPGGNPKQGDDAAIAAIELDDTRNVMAVPLHLFVTPQIISNHAMGVGEDVFMMGLFADLEESHPPKARFGNISMMAHDTAPIEQPNGTTQKSSFVLDMHSRSGFSGSPVFFYRTIGANLDHANMTTMMLNEPSLFGLLGLHWGQFPELFTSTDEYGRRLRLEGLSGMTCAIPAWRLIDLFNVPELLAMRDKKDDEDRKNPKYTSAARAEQRS